MSLSAVINRAVHHTFDLILRVDANEVLNPGEPLEGPANPAQALMQASRAMQASAVDPASGWIRYAALRESEAYAGYRQIARSLPRCKRADLGEGGRLLAFWINLYNALIIDAVLHYGIEGSLSDHLDLFRRAAYNVGGMRFSADDIEHGVLRANRRHPYLPVRQFARGDPRLALAMPRLDARLHFALVCGAHSCPPIAYYDGERIEEQLDRAAAAFINGEGVRYDPHGRLYLSKIFQWYEGDFGGKEGVLHTIKRYTRDDALRQAIEGGGLRVRYLPYDWTLNKAV